MSLVHFCDICKEVLKNKVYFIAVQEYDMRQQESKSQYETMTAEDFQRKLRGMVENQPDYKEVCPVCFKIYKMLLGARQEKLTKLRAELDKLEKQFKDDK